MHLSPEQNPKRILMTGDALGGVWTYALDLARALEKTGVEVILATMGPPLSKGQRREAQSRPNIEVRETEFKLEWMKDPWEDIKRAGDWLLELERSACPDVIHLNGFVHGALPWSAPKVVVGHSCVCSWWESVWGGILPKDWELYRDLVGKGIRAADLIVAPSAWMLGKLDEFYGPLPLSAVIYNGRDHSLFQSGCKEKLVLGVGRLWDKAKNFSVLERVAENLSSPLCVAGEKNHPNGGGIQFGKIHCLGVLSSEALAQWYGRAGIFVSTALYEPFGLAAIEAGLSGCALVLSDIPSLREIWEEAAVFVSPCDVEAIRSTLEELLADEARRKTLGQAARSRAVQFSPERMGASYWAAYCELLRKRRTQPELQEATA